VIVTLIPAAGASSRMGGRDKLLETIKGETILARTARIACEAKLGPVLVTLRPKDRARRKALRSSDVELLELDASEGMSASLRLGAKIAQQKIMAHREDDYEYSGMMVLLPDMPEISTDDLMELDHTFQATGGPCVRATTQDGAPGHPNIFPVNVLYEFDSLSGDRGAASMFETERVVLHALTGERARLDLDTPDAWAAWREKTNTPF
jgi:CTP:molybdopterin cytidylyltransferase MocA